MHGRDVRPGPEKGVTRGKVVGVQHACTCRRAGRPPAARERARLLSVTRGPRSSLRRPWRRDNFPPSVSNGLRWCPWLQALLAAAGAVPSPAQEPTSVPARLFPIFGLGGLAPRPVAPPAPPAKAGQADIIVISDEEGGPALRRPVPPSGGAAAKPLRGGGGSAPAHLFDPDAYLEVCWHLACRRRAASARASSHSVGRRAEAGRSRRHPRRRTGCPGGACNFFYPTYLLAHTYC